MSSYWRLASSLPHRQLSRYFFFVLVVGQFNYICLWSAFDSTLLYVHFIKKFGYTCIVATPVRPSVRICTSICLSRFTFSNCSYYILQTIKLNSWSLICVVMSFCKKVTKNFWWSMGSKKFKRPSVCHGSLSQTVLSSNKSANFNLVVWFRVLCCLVKRFQITWWPGVQMIVKNDVYHKNSGSSNSSISNVNKSSLAIGVCLKNGVSYLTSGCKKISHI